MVEAEVLAQLGRADVVHGDGDGVGVGHQVLEAACMQVGQPVSSKTWIEKLTRKCAHPLFVCCMQTAWYLLVMFRRIPIDRCFAIFSG